MTSSSCTLAKNFSAVDFHASHAEFFYTMLQLGNREVRILERHGAQADEAIRPPGHDLGQALVHLPGELGAHPRLGPVVGLLRGRRHRLDVDPHAVHVLQPHLDAGELGRALRHLLLVRLARERVGELDLHLVLRRVERRHLGGRLRVEVMAVDVDPQALALLLYGGGRARSRTPAGGCAAVHHRKKPPGVKVCRG
jgi:hypothetical protein